MYALATVLILITSVFLILIVLVQESKGGGLASNFSSSNQIMGVKKTTDFLEKATWGLAIFLVVLSLVATMSIPRNTEGNRESAIQEQVNNTIDETAIPTIPSEDFQVEEEGAPTEQPADIPETGTE